MEGKQIKRRIFVLLSGLALIVMSFVWVLYDLQIVNGAAYAAQSARKIASTETVEADRGDILDRYGRTLVSNTTSYQVTLKPSMMTDCNQTILTLLQVCREQAVTWTDTLPVSSTAPFTYTDEAVFSASQTDAEGNSVTSLTRLGKLTEKLGDWTTGCTAPELIAAMRESFALDESLSDADARALLGVLYEMELRSREITWTSYVFAENVDINFISRVKELGLSGVSVDAVSSRQYDTTYAAHLLGRVGLMSESEWATYQGMGYSMDENVGKDGAEKAFQEYLRGTAGTQVVEANTAGKIVGQSWLTEPEPGDNVILTLDLGLQAAVEDAMASYVPVMAEGKAEGAAAVMIGVDSGEVLAMASYPTFDLSQYAQSYNDLVSDELSPLFNRATQGIYAPGSTFKPVTAIAGLEEGIITPTTKILDTGIYRYYSDYQPRCWLYRKNGTTHGYQNVSQAITNSCNIFFYDVGRRLGIKNIEKYAAMFGLGQKTGVEIPESTGVMAGPEYTESLGLTWTDGATLSVAIGQENSQFTPIQLANYIATLVNGGTRYKTHLLKAVKSSDYSKILYEYTPEALDTIDIKKENLDAVKAGMLDLTTTGSVAQYFAHLNVKVGAKTGSAQVNASSDESNAVFVCFAPFDDPQVALAIVVEKGSTGSYLGAMAAEILTYYFNAESTLEAVQSENQLIR